VSTLTTISMSLEGKARMSRLEVFMGDVRRRQELVEERVEAVEDRDLDTAARLNRLTETLRQRGLLDELREAA
jgi:hypothetical protein